MYLSFGAQLVASHYQTLETVAANLLSKPTWNVSQPDKDIASGIIDFDRLRVAWNPGIPGSRANETFLRFTDDLRHPDTDVTICSGTNSAEKLILFVEMVS